MVTTSTRRRRRADSVPLTVTQQLQPNTQRLCSLLSALLLRQPAPPLDNRDPWQLFDHPATAVAAAAAAAAPERRQPRDQNILLLVITETTDGASTGCRGWPDDEFVRGLQQATRPSSFFFAWQLARSNDNSSSAAAAAATAAHFDCRWLRLMSTLSASTRVHVIVGSQAALAHVARHLDEEPALHSNIVSVMSVLSTSNEAKGDDSSSGPLVPHLPEHVYHWMTHINSAVPASRQGVLAVAGHARTLSLTLTKTTTSSAPTMSWLVRAAIYFAHAVEVVENKDEESFMRARL